MHNVTLKKPSVEDIALTNCVNVELPELIAEEGEQDK
jgi:hypothetical protein